MSILLVPKPLVSHTSKTLNGGRHRFTPTWWCENLPCVGNINTINISLSQMTHLQTVSGDKWFFYQVLLITYNFSRCQMFWHFESCKQSIKLLTLCHSILRVGYYILFYLTFWCSGQTIQRKMAQYLGCWWPCCVDYTQVTSDTCDNTLWMKCGGPGCSHRASVYILKVESFTWLWSAIPGIDVIQFCKKSTDTHIQHVYAVHEIKHDLK